MIPWEPQRKRTEIDGTVDEGRRVACYRGQVLELPSHIHFLSPSNFLARPQQVVNLGICPAEPRESPFEFNDYCISGGTPDGQPLWNPCPQMYMSLTLQR